MSEDQLRAWMEVNRLNWDDRTAVHLRNGTDFYPIDQVRAGDNAFGEPEDSELGDVAGKRIVHLQCHFGLDTIRLARRGAIVTGLDFSTAAIAAARALAAELGVHALRRGQCLRLAGSPQCPIRYCFCHVGIDHLAPRHPSLGADCRGASGAGRVAVPRGGASFDIVARRGRRPAGRNPSMADANERALRLR